MKIKNLKMLWKEITSSNSKNKSKSSASKKNFEEHSLKMDMGVNEVLLYQASHSIMSVLVALYESELITSVRMKDVMKLYGVDSDTDDIVDLYGEVFQQDYQTFLENKKVIEKYRKTYSKNMVRH